MTDKEMLSPTEFSLKQFETYRAEDKHECDLLTKRISSFLISQSFLATAAATLYGLHPQVVTWIAVIPLVIAVTTSIAICTGCMVLQAWHRYGMLLLKTTPWLSGFYLPRYQPDWRHKVSMDFFHLTIPLLFGAGWGIFIVWNLTRSKCLCSIVVAAGLGIWTSLLGLVWRNGKKINPTPEMFKYPVGEPGAGLQGASI